MYFEFDDARRIHMPYIDSYTRVPIWKTPTYNSPTMNWKRGMYAMSPTIFVVSQFCKSKISIVDPSLPYSIECRDLELLLRVAQDETRGKHFHERSI